MTHLITEVSSPVAGEPATNPAAASRGVGAAPELPLPLVGPNARYLPASTGPANAPRFTLVYDETCELCRRCRHWLSTQRTHVRLDFLAAGSPAGQQRYGDLPWYRIELMVVADDGTAWVGGGAFVMALWSTVRYRSLAYRLRSPHFAPLAEWFFHSLSANRGLISGMLRSHHCEDGACSTSAAP